MTRENLKKILFYVLTLTYFPIQKFLIKSRGTLLVPKKGKFILAANHSSYLDPFILYLFFYWRCGLKIRFLAAEYLLKNPIIRLHLYLTDSIIVLNNKLLTFRKTLKALKSGDSIGIFPEGRRHRFLTRDNRTGVLRLANVSGVMILPVRIRYSKISILGKSIPYNAKIYITSPFSVKYSKKKLENKNFLKRKTYQLMKKIYSL